MTFIENVVKYTNVMQYVKENVADIIILILLAVWGIYEVLMIPFLYDTIVSVFIVVVWCVFSLGPAKVRRLNIKESEMGLCDTLSRL